MKDEKLKSLLGKHKEKAEDEARQSKSVFEPRHRGRLDASPSDLSLNKEIPKASILSKYLPKEVAEMIRKKCKERLEDFTTRGSSNKVVQLQRHNKAIPNLAGGGLLSHNEDEYT